MSLLNGFQGQQAARQPGRTSAQDPAQTPAAAGWGQPQAPQAPQAQWGQQQPAQPQQPYAPAGYAPAFGAAQPQSSFGQGQDYHFPQQAAHQAPSHQQTPAQQGFGAVDPYAPQFEPYTPAAPPAPRGIAQPHQAAAYQPSQPQAAPQPYQPQAYQPQPVYVPQQPGYGAEPARHAPQAHQLHQHSQQPQPAQSSWGQAAHQPPQQQPDLRGGFDISGFGHPQQPLAQQAAYRHQSEPQYQDAEPSLSDWGQPQNQGGYQGEAQDDMGFAQPAGGELDPAYGEEDLEDEYETEAPSRFRRPAMIAAALVGAIVIGGGMAQGYKYFLGGGANGDPPVVKSATGPSKVKPADAGGKQFAHSDSKIMGRLGDGATATATAEGASAASATEADAANGSRKVATLVVGRDGSIQAPAASAAEPAPAPQATAPQASAPMSSGSTVSVPGLTVVDAFGGQKPPVADIAAAAPASSQKIVVAPPAAAPPQKPVTIAKATQVAAPVAPQQTGSIAADAETPAPVAPKKVKKVAAAAPAVVSDAASASPSVAATGSGYVAVLASVPRSDSSRMTALKQFADMQQKYGATLAGKTPDVAEANLGAKGNYHRLVVGPPGSREQANSLCSQLKTQGFTNCWVTSY